ncbi:MAG: glycosyltransferase [Lentisphaeria bacterium]|nr:glycosyltransferase [Lentisphaeria bacterium]
MLHMLRQGLLQLQRWYSRTSARLYLPCIVFCRDPLVLVCYDWDFINCAKDFLNCFSKNRAKSIHVFLQLGWETESPKNSEAFARAIKDILPQCSRLKITVLANSRNEEKILSGLGLHAVFCNQNAFVEESRYPLLRIPKRYDAIYIARLSPFKRHPLAAKIASLRLIGDRCYWIPGEAKYSDDIVFNQLKHAVWTPHIYARGIPAEIAAAHCGLCLSQTEGAMFVSIEYLLCGIPIVNTSSLGGRDELFPDFAVKTVPDTPEAIAEAVQSFVEHAPDPEKIRAAALEKMKSHRETLRRLFNEAMAPKTFPDSRPFPHKLILRCTKTPLQFLRYGLRK